MFERYTEKARRVVFYSRYEASNLGEAQIKSTHLLLGLLREGKAVFFRLHLPEKTLETLREACTKTSSVGHHIPTSVDMPLDQEADKIIRRTFKEADIRKDKYIDLEHLLLALLQVPSGAKNILQQQGMAYQQARDLLFRPPSGISAGDTFDYT